MVRILLVVLVLVGLYWLLRRQYRQSPRRMLQWLAIAAGAGLVLLVLSGRAHWLVGVAGAALPFLGKAALVLLRFMPFLSLARRLAGGRTLRFDTAWLEITVDRATGAMDGRVRRGEFRNRRLSGLGASELEHLLQACQADPPSAALLRTYLQRARPEWQEPGSGGAAADDFEEAAMSVETAARILGVAPHATAEEIRAAHRSLAQKLHPDRGGSDYLTRKINQARDTLLKASGGP